MNFIFIVELFNKLYGEDVWSAVFYDPYNNGDRDINDDIKFHLYTKKNPDSSYLLLPWNNENYANSPFNPSFPTIIFSHGFTGSASSRSAQTIKNLCWKLLAVKPWYLKAIRNVPVVGKYTANLIKWLEYKQAISLPALHVIGFSLGAHVGAFIGEELARNRSQKIGRLTGLDPAGPAFDKLSISSNGLDKDDAAFVDIIHTNTRTFGMNLAVGHADFYVNHGKSQPGCGIFSISCSHFRAWEYYSESVFQPCGFPSERCDTWKPSVSGCSQSQTYMGVATNRKTRGIFNVKTNSAYPFATNSVNLPNNVKVVSAKSNYTLSYIDAEESGIFDLSYYCINANVYA
ncbi:hypothetical protein PV327_008499 [Microctonus hyperodae]|uniref:phospholipase A1 n=1 Tax=Microctonus hyperodae TaxID=165561 RepID=A0AA39F399_MICHY|nr:hypothetical protein PV327_008499 [Microctonus hyperodae]